MHTNLMSKGKFECALGFHEYTIPDKEDPEILICKHCRRFGYNKGNFGFECWTELDDSENEVHFRNNRGYEYWSKYDDKGNIIHYKNNHGYEVWYEYDDKGNLMEVK